MSSNLVPVNKAKEQELKDKLSKFKVFGSPDQFIELYNSGVISASNDLVREFTDEILDTYINITKNRSRILTRTLEEVAAENISEMVRGWEILSKIKRFSNYMVDESYPADAKIVFLRDRMPGTPMIENPVVDPDTQEVIKVELVPHWASDKVAASLNEMLTNKIVAVYLKKYDGEEDGCYLNVFDLVDLDNSFLLDVQDVFLKKTFRENA